MDHEEMKIVERSSWHDQKRRGCVFVTE